MDDSSRLVRVRRTACEMLEDRGYLVNPRDRDMTLEMFKDEIGTDADKMRILVQMRHDPSDQLIVFFAEAEDKDKKVGVKPIRAYFDQMKEAEVLRAIIVTPTGLGSKSKAFVNEVPSKYRIEHFTQNELLVNITKHELVPEHRLLTDEEQQRLLQRYRVDKPQLPRISSNDPVARYYGLVKGQIVKITRPSETAGRYVTYRLVE